MTALKILKDVNAIILVKDDFLRSLHSSKHSHTKKAVWCKGECFGECTDLKRWSVTTIMALVH